MEKLIITSTTANSWIYPDIHALKENHFPETRQIDSTRDKVLNPDNTQPKALRMLVHNSDRSARLFQKKEWPRRNLLGSIGDNAASLSGTCHRLLCCPCLYVQVESVPH